MESFISGSEELKKSREERVREAKMKFSGDGYESLSEVPFEREESFSFYRPFFSLLVLILLITAFQFHFSFHGIDRNRVEQVLSDDSHYQSLVRQAEMVIRHLDEKRKK